jgi:hypothetical protein
MKTTVLVLCLVALAAPSQATQRTKPSTAPDDMATRAQMCRAIVGRELPEATDGRSHEGQLNVQRFSDCLMGKLPSTRLDEPMAPPSREAAMAAFAKSWRRE